jgi:RES domain-containing protein
MARQPRKQTAEQARKLRWQIESGTRGVYVGSKYADRTTNWPLFSWSPDEARAIRFDDREAAEAELGRVQSFAANARLREVG